MHVMFLVWLKDDGRFLCIKERDRYMRPPLLTPSRSTLLPVIPREVKHASQQRQSKPQANPQAVSFFCPLCTGNPYLMHSVFELYCFTSPSNNIEPSACHKVSRTRNSRSWHKTREVLLSIINSHKITIYLNSATMSYNVCNACKHPLSIFFSR